MPTLLIFHCQLLEKVNELQERPTEAARPLQNCPVYVSKCSTSIHFPHIQIVLTKHIAALGHKM